MHESNMSKHVGKDDLSESTMEALKGLCIRSTEHVGSDANLYRLERDDLRSKGTFTQPHMKDSSWQLEIGFAELGELFNEGFVVQAPHGVKVSEHCTVIRAGLSQDALDWYANRMRC